MLVDEGLISLDTDMRKLYPALDKAAARIFKGLDQEQKPIFETNDKPVTLGQMLNQSSGFGMEFGDKVPEWKKITEKGKGFVNSCKVENLIHTPITFSPGTHYEYGNSAEWLALMFPTISQGREYEEFLQDRLCGPLGMKGTTFFPFGKAWDDRLRVLRYARDAGGRPGGAAAPGETVKEPKDWTWEKLDGQLDLLTLPRKREEIEYPAGGGGVYSRTCDYVLLLQHLMRHYLSLDSSSNVTPPAHPLLSDSSVKSLFYGTLSQEARPAMEKMLSWYLDTDISSGEADWTTGMSLYAPREGNTTRTWGRKRGSVGWGGAAGTMYWIDPTSQIAVVWTTQMLPGQPDYIRQGKKDIERLIYESLESR
ncbi:beta-lactamase/transpeptidase-like protein [Kockovaella imperatae]|uniref:Beta-lactamase/transpeptidase-like protein n=1 Tax=Kockovaella imperatae TaxID=4999 RepID=A0A1Y1UK54_9TREE|nr:beta-lactamase/transpeptidase-like protein [Kockovaella imperatae]ORX37917.1 beta-lactamase/transpeptidase-like protein [Kockovaella imperatae]